MTAGYGGVNYPRGFSVQGAYGQMYQLAGERYDGPEYQNDRYPEVSKQTVYNNITQRIETGMSLDQAVDAMVAYSKISAKEIHKIYNDYKDR